MSSKTPAMLRYSLTAKWSQIVLCAILLLVGLCYTLRRFTTVRMEAKPPTARMTPAQARQRALAFCAAFDYPCQVIGAPMFHDRALNIPPVIGRYRRQWVVTCLCNKSVFGLVINDLTGNLCCLFYEGDLPGGKLPTPATAPLATGRDAVNAAIHRLRDLQIVAPEEEIALASAPYTVDAGKAWSVSWKVRDSARSPSRSIRMVLTREGSLPVDIINQKELDSLADR